jgi:hypothetical protein
MAVGKKESRCRRFTPVAAHVERGDVMPSNTRRWFFTTALGAAFTAAGLRRSFAAGVLTITVPAQQMRSRANGFRHSLLTDYVVPKTPYPIYSVLFRSGLLPDDINAERQLGRCGNIVFAGNVARLSSPPATDLMLPYHILLSDQQLRNQITIPKQLTITITRGPNDESTRFDFSPAIGVHQVDRYTINGIVAPIPADLQLATIYIDANLMRYELNASNGISYHLVLDFTKAAGPPVISGSMRRRGSRLAALVAACCLGLTGCINNVGSGGGSGSSQPPPPYPDQEVCYNQPAPSGYIRINSKAGGLAGCPSTGPTALNIFVYTNYVNQPSKTQLEVCADAPIPSGWYDVSGAYHDEHGCDSAQYSGTSYANARLIYKS